MKWFTRVWWEYLLEGAKTWQQVWCRARGHGSPIFYNPGGLEPDMRCEHCREDLG